MPVPPDAAAAEELSNVIRNRLREIPNLDIQHAIGGRLDAALLLPYTQRHRFLCEVLIDLDRSAPAPQGYPVPTGASELTRELLRLLALPDSQRDGDVARAILVQLERVLGDVLGRAAADAAMQGAGALPVAPEAWQLWVNEGGLRQWMEQLLKRSTASLGPEPFRRRIVQAAREVGARLPLVCFPKVLGAFPDECLLEERNQAANRGSLKRDPAASRSEFGSDPMRLGKYCLLELIATGGMGEIFLARQDGPAGFSKTVVIKRILKQLAADTNFVEMFLNEARLAALLSHPNVVQIFELGQEGETYFLAMEFVHGRSLRLVRQLLIDRHEPMPGALAARVCGEALRGLHYAHQLRDESGNPLDIVHRDISPDNILVSFDGRVKVLDFGIAKAANTISTTRAGTVKGKYAYMAPEQLQGKAVDARSDVYSLGVVLYELVAGARPFEAVGDAALFQAVLHETPRLPSLHNPQVPTALERIIMKSLSRAPSGRFASAEEMADDLEQFAVSCGLTVSPAHVGAFMRQLFGTEVAEVNPASRTPHSSPDLAGLQVASRRSQVVAQTVLLATAEGPAISTLGLRATAEPESAAEEEEAVQKSS